MNDEAREARNKYMREWRKRNKEKQKEAMARYWEKRARRSYGKNRNEERKSAQIEKII